MRIFIVAVAFVSAACTHAPPLQWPTVDLNYPSTETTLVSERLKSPKNQPVSETLQAQLLKGVSETHRQTLEAMRDHERVAESKLLSAVLVDSGNAVLSFRVIRRYPPGHQYFYTEYFTDSYALVKTDGDWRIAAFYRKNGARIVS